VEGFPEAVTENEAEAGTVTVRAEGCEEMMGAYCTVSVAALLVAVPTAFVATSRNCALLSEATVEANKYVVEVAPLIGVQTAPINLCHWKVGAG